MAFDVETTGTCAWRDRVVSFCLMELDEDLAVLREHYELVNPGLPIPAAATAVHGVTDDMVQDALPFSRFARRLRGLLTSAPVIGYNVQFDLDVVHHELMRCGLNGMPVDLPTVDPFIVFCQDHPRTLSGALEAYCGERHDAAHNPLSRQKRYVWANPVGEALCDTQWPEPFLSPLCPLATNTSPL